MYLCWLGSVCLVDVIVFIFVWDIAVDTEVFVWWGLWVKALFAFLSKQKGNRTAFAISSKGIFSRPCLFAFGRPVWDARQARLHNVYFFQYGKKSSAGCLFPEGSSSNLSLRTSVSEWCISGAPEQLGGKKTHQLKKTRGDQNSNN